MTPSLPARRPFLLASCGMALLTAMDALAKALSSGYPTVQIVLVRFLVTAVLVGAVVLASRRAGGRGWPRPDRLRAHLARAVLTVITASAFFYAVGRMKLAEVFALSFTSPILTALFAAAILKEKIGRRTVFAISTGLVGVGVILWGTPPQAGAGAAGTPPLALACALLSPVSYALGVVLLRAQTFHEPLATIVAVQSLLVSVLLLPVAAAFFVWPDPRDLAVFGALGVLGAAGSLAFAGGLKHMSAARFSAVEYTGLLWAALLGLAFFSERPTVSLGAGASLIIGGCLLAAGGRGGRAAPA